MQHWKIKSFFYKRKHDLSLHQKLSICYRMAEEDKINRTRTRAGTPSNSTDTLALGRRYHANSSLAFRRPVAQFAAMTKSTYHCLATKACWGEPYRFLPCFNKLRTFLSPFTICVHCSSPTHFNFANVTAAASNPTAIDYAI